MLHGLELPFFFHKSQLLLFQFRLTGSDFRLELVLLIGLRVILLIKLPVAEIKSFEGSFCQFNTDFAVILFNFVIFLRFPGLTFQGFQLVINFEKKVFNAFLPKIRFSNLIRSSLR